MTLDEAYPAAPTEYKTDDGFFKGPVIHACESCRRPTAWFHVSLAAHLCSRSCYKRYCGERLASERSG